jgi:hypothetical protein
MGRVASTRSVRVGITGLHPASPSRPPRGRVPQPIPAQWVGHQLGYLGRPKLISRQAIERHLRKEQK